MATTPLGGSDADPAWCSEGTDAVARCFHKSVAERERSAVPCNQVYGLPPSDEDEYVRSEFQKRRPGAECAI